LDLASKTNCKYGLMIDDDYLLPYRDFVKIIKEYLKIYHYVGIVGGGVIPLRKRSQDPDFFLNLPYPFS
jgi:hypothetical protein